MKKVILITGCSSGFGMLTAARLSAAGHRVYATMRDLSRSNDLRHMAGSANPVILPLDVTRPETIKAALQEIAARGDAIDVLINNAGYGVGGFFEDLTDTEFRAQFETNFFGVLNVTRTVLPLMRARRSGRIINISSMAAFSGTPALSAYVASKWALEGFTESLAIELKPFNIDVVLVEPGAYKTRIFFENAARAARFDDQSSPYYPYNQHLKQLVNKHMAANKRDPEEVARVLQDLVESRRTSFRNIISLQSRLRMVLVKCLPFRLYAWLVSTILMKKAGQP